MNFSKKDQTILKEIVGLLMTQSKQEYETALVKLDEIDNQDHWEVKKIRGNILIDLSRYFPTYTPQYIQAIDELKKANELNPDCFEVL